MTATLYSAQWYRIARLCPRLRAQVRVQPQRSRGERWVLLTDAATGRQHRLNAQAYRFIGRCDGQRTVQDVWQTLLEQSPDDAPTQDEVLALLGQLDALELLQSAQAPDLHELERRRREQRARRRRALLNPLAFRLPLGDPMPWLQRLDPWARRLWCAPVAWLWALAMLVALVVALDAAPALRAHAAQRWASPWTWLTVWLVYPLMKALHELGHALALRRWGGEVREAGIGFVLLTPAPYVDASAAAAFPRARQRAAVSAAGIMVELVLAALALAVWCQAQPGVVRDVALVVMALGSVSTLLFNGNPLLRYDGYHLLCDLARLPNLAVRSAAWWRAQLARHLLGSPLPLPAAAAGETVWLALYAPAALAWRLVLALTLLLWLGGSWLGLALAGLAWAALALLAAPLWRWAREAQQAAAPGAALARVRLRLALLAAAAVLGLGVWPWPHHVRVPAVVWLPESAQLRVQTEGVVAELPLPDGAQVRPGDLLLRLEQPELHAQRAQLAARREGLQVAQYQKLLADPAGAGQLAQELASTQAELDRLDQRLDGLALRAGVAGRLVLPQAQDLPGRHVRAGTTLGHVLAPGPVRLRAAVPEDLAARVLAAGVTARARLADQPAAAWPAERLGEVAGATRRLPGDALAETGGGPLAVDASAPADGGAPLALQPVFLVDLRVPGLGLERVGARAWVDFDLGAAPLALQAWQALARVFLQAGGAAAAGPRVAEAAR